MAFHLTAFLWPKPGKEVIFEAYERQAMAILKKYGKLLTAFRPEASRSTSATDVPFEIHYLLFSDPVDFENFRSDPELQKLKSVRESCIAKTELFAGTEQRFYGM